MQVLSASISHFIIFTILLLILHLKLEILSNMNMTYANLFFLGIKVGTGLIEYF